MADYPCGCPKRRGHRINDRDLHLAWHALVVEQGGPAGRVDFGTLPAARGQAADAPDMHSIRERHLKQGKSSPKWRREAGRG